MPGRTGPRGPPGSSGRRGRKGPRGPPGNPGKSAQQRTNHSGGGQLGKTCNKYLLIVFVVVF